MLRRCEIQRYAGYKWTESLFGLKQDRVAAADEALRSLKIETFERELLVGGDADSLIGTLLLGESLDYLTDHGVERTRLISKLRSDPDIWPTWAEIRAADLLAKHCPEGSHLVFEPDRSRGRHSDYAFVWGSGERASIEFKALGLSDREVSWSAAMMPALRSLFARPGLITLNVPDGRLELSISRAERRRIERDARSRIKNIPVKTFHSISGSIAVARSTEETYLRRLKGRLTEALDQLPTDEASYVAFHWSNGAPSWLIRTALREIPLPDTLLGVFFVGSVAVPGNLHNFIVQLPAPYDDETMGEWEFRSEQPDIAEAVWNFVEASGGVRAMVLRVPSEEGWAEFIVRDGQRRILPFNILLDHDMEFEPRVSPNDPK